MKFNILESFAAVSLLVLVLFLHIHAHVANAEIVELNSSNFETITELGQDGSTGDWLLTFCLPRAKTCQQLDRILRRIDRASSDEVTLARVDVNSNRELARRFGVTEFPTLLYISRAQVFQYDGEFSVDAIKEFMVEGYNLRPAKDVASSLTFMGELGVSFQMAFQKAYNDLLTGNLASSNLLLSLFPILLVAVLLFMALAPLPASRYDAEFIRQREEVEKFQIMKRASRDSLRSNSSDG